MAEERDWVFEIKKKYISELLDEAESRADEKHYLKSGLEALLSLQKGEQFIPLKAIKNAAPNVSESPSGGLYAWLDEFSGKLGAGVVERRIENNQAINRIRKEFYKAVKDVLKNKP